MQQNKNKLSSSSIKEYEEKSKKIFVLSMILTDLIVIIKMLFKSQNVLLSHNNNHIHIINITLRA